VDTSRSDRMAKTFLARRQPYKRKTLVYRYLFHAPRTAVFKQLCPAREADWIDGWEADLIWTSTGYVEADCIFTTPAHNSIGPGLWIFTRLEPDRCVELVRIIEDNVVEHIKIDVEDTENGNCRGTWTLKFTAISEEGNRFIDALPDHDPDFDSVLAGLDLFLATDRQRGTPTAGHR